MDLKGNNWCLKILCSMLLHSVSIKTFFFRPNCRNFVSQFYVAEFCNIIKQDWSKSTLSFWDLNQFDDPRFRHCGMWYTHVDTRVAAQLTGHMLDMTRVHQLSKTRGESMIHSVASVLVWSIWVNHSCSHVSANTCLTCLNCIWDTCSGTWKYLNIFSCIFCMSTTTSTV